MEVMSRSPNILVERKIPNTFTLNINHLDNLFLSLFHFVSRKSRYMSKTQEKSTKNPNSPCCKSFKTRVKPSTRFKKWFNKIKLIRSQISYDEFTRFKQNRYRNKINDQAGKEKSKLTMESNRTLNLWGKPNPSLWRLEERKRHKRSNEAARFQESPAFGRTFEGWSTRRRSDREDEEVEDKKEG